MTASLILQLRSVTIRVVDSPTLVTGEAPQSNKDVTQVVNTCLRPLPIRLSLLYRFAVSHYKQIIKVKRENSGLYSKTAKRRQRDRTMLFADGNQPYLLFKAARTD